MKSTALPLHISIIYRSTRVYIVQPVLRHILSSLDWLAKTLRNSTGDLGLYIWEEHGRLQWWREGELPTPPNVLIRRGIFSLCRKLTGQLPVCGWLHVATEFEKQSAVTTRSDNEVQDPLLRRMLVEIITRASQTDPSSGDWFVNEQDVIVDASSLVTSGWMQALLSQVLSVKTADAKWLQLVHEDRSINLAGLDAVLKSVNLALRWKANVILGRRECAPKQRQKYWLSAS